MDEETLLTDSAAPDAVNQSEEAQGVQEIQGVQEVQEVQEVQDASTSEPQNAVKEVEKVAEEYVFEAPEGRSFDPELIAKFGELAGELGLSNEGANKLVNGMSQMLEQKQQHAIEQVQQGWIESAKADSEFGGDALNASLGHAKKALDAFGTPELTAFLNETGAGNHPEVIRAFVKIGRMLSEDGLVKGSASTPERSITDILYPNM